jgi:hypothetical protein
MKEYFICGPPEWRLNAKADPVALCNQVLGRQAVVKVLDGGSVLAVDDLTPNEIKTIVDINFDRHKLDQWESSKLRSLTIEQINNRIATVQAQIDAVTNIATAKTALNSMYADMQKMARIILWLLKRETGELR